MKEYFIEVEIDENGDIKLDSKGFEGEICASEISEILEGIEGEEERKNKPEYYKKTSVQNKNQIKLRG